MRSKLAHWVTRSSRSRPVMVVLAAVVALAVAGSTLGYSALSKSVTLSLDGDAQDVSSMASTVADVLEDQGVEVSARDQVAPGLEEEVRDGMEISVRFARPVQLTVDGDTSTHWVTATEVAGALGEIGRDFRGADLSASRGGSIDREGMALEVVTPKTLKVKLGAKDWKKRTVTALTVSEALEELGVDVGGRDETKPGLGSELADGDRIVFTDVRVVTREVTGEAIDFATTEREDGSMLEGETSTVRAGREGLRNVTYRLMYRNGELVGRVVTKAEVTRRPVDAIVRVGTKEPEPEVAAPNYASGGTVWDALAKCESGGNWAINTGNGYYGGLQFSLSTWHAYGGPGYPHQQSRETQIAIAEKVRAATGGYGSWPHCSQSLGLPQ
ncbi:transglycosylase family protein [Nocardioides sp. SOB77]|uniref:Transglycosylase family protein n=1 Tax=Nocardioides oceani TaxID=3058369 RepID=A0ABT8FB10_9ACTN|nr:resuscitation-promoting factor [Nocardioides oceani]MDN4171587.1 transglycosylase family protein [Nocardioides oceani]